jgi:hypothetical protein
MKTERMRFVRAGDVIERSREIESRAGAAIEEAIGVVKPKAETRIVIYRSRRVSLAYN